MRKLAARHEGLAQIAIAVAGLGTYELLRHVQRPNWPLALEHAREIVSWERFAHMEWEPALQSAVLRVPGLLPALDGFYFVGHFVLTAVFFLWLYRRSRPAFRFFRNGFLATTVIALLVHRFFPTAPPRLANVGLVHPGFGLAGLSNPVAAVPSLHAGWALGVGIGVARYARPVRWRVAGALYPPAVLLTIVATGNHFFLDAVAGMAVLGLGFGSVSALTRCRLRVPETNRVPMRASLFAAAIGMMVVAVLGGSSIVSAHRAAVERRARRHLQRRIAADDDEQFSVRRNALDVLVECVRSVRRLAHATDSRSALRLRDGA